MFKWNIDTVASTTNSATFRILEGEVTISHQRFLDLIVNSEDFMKLYNSRLGDCDYKAFFWENKPVTNRNLDEPYEFRLIDSDYLAGADPSVQTFQQYFEAGREVVSFSNLGGDAQLVVPCPVEDHSVYTHIGNFVRYAPEAQILSFWKKIGIEMQNRVSDEPIWLSTSGLGVSWLHVRLDSVPKYYQTESYKQLA